MREEILTEAGNQLREGGYHYLNFAMIAERLGTTRANLHYHFQNKHGLAMAALDRYLIDQENGLQDMASKFPGDFPGFLLTLYKGMWNRMKSCQFNGHCVADRLVNEGCDVPEDLREKASLFNNSYLKVFIPLIEDSQKAKKVKDKRNAERIAREALAIMNGVAQILKALPEERKEGSATTQVLEQWIGRITTAS